MTEPEAKLSKPKPKPKIKVPKNKKAGTSLALLGLMIALVACAGVGYLWWHNQLIIKQAKTGNQNFQKQINAQLSKAQQTMAAQQQALQSINQTVTTIQNVQGRDDTAWVLERSNYLLHVAKYNLEFEHDVPVAIKILQLMDKQLQALNNTTVLQLRKTLANDIAALQGIKPIDKAGIILRINALGNQVTTLPVIPTRKAGKTPPTTATTDEPLLKHVWEKSLASLKSAVIVRYHEQPIAPLLSPQQKSYLVENVMVQFSLASLAVLQNDQKVFAASLKQANQWLTQYFVQNDQGTQSLLQAISQLEKVNLQPQLPDLSDSFAALKALQKP